MHFFFYFLHKCDAIISIVITNCSLTLFYYNYFTNNNSFEKLSRQFHRRMKKKKKRIILREITKETDTNIIAYNRREN